MILYFAGSWNAENKLQILEDKKTGVLFSFFDIPKKRMKQIKKQIKRKEQKKI